MTFRNFLFFGLLGVAATGKATAAPDFEKEIRPILENRCYECHGPKKQKSGYRLDVKDVAFHGGDDAKTAITPGKSSESALIKRVLSSDKEEQMPPKGDRLSAQEITLLQQWIDGGAQWTTNITSVTEQKHWAYVPPIKPAIPAVQNKKWVKNPIDAFVLARLEKERLQPTEPATKNSLLRRISLDLTGLPPTFEEVAEMAKSKNENWDALVEKKLNSSAFGEQWARVWLDLARYADSHGYERDPGRSMWVYRDWVINAFNANMPFDRFTTEQLAGDLMPGATVEQKIASGFHRNTMLNTEGGVDPETARLETIVDRVNTTATVWLGSTLACAQCHTHKYDPFTISDYYKFFAFFNNSDEPQIEVPSSGQTERRKSLEASIAGLEKSLKTSTPEQKISQAAWEYSLAESGARWSPLSPVGALSSGGATLTIQNDHSVLASGANPATDTYTLVGSASFTRLTGMKLDVLTDPSLPNGSSGRHPNGSFVITEVKLKVSKDAADTTNYVAFKRAAADYSQKDHDPNNLINGNKQGWAIDSSKPEMRVPRYVLFETQQPVIIEPGSVVTVIVKSESTFKQANPGRIAVSLTDGASPIPSELIPAKILNLLSVAPRERSASQKEELASYYHSIAPEFKEDREKLATHKKELDRLKKEIPTALVLNEKQKPRDTHVFVRGNFTNPGDSVTPAVPGSLTNAPLSAPNRLGLAQWLVNRNNPLTARVMVNRIWAQYFGKGIVESQEDFGTQGTAPTHPELLDWLACEFMDSGWDMKHMHRLIVESSTYRQASRVTPALLERDPDNRLYARGPRFRVPAEEVRDIALEVSGLLAHTIGGPSVFPPQPEGIWSQIYSSDKWSVATNESRFRRGLYTYWKRTSPYPTFTMFDAPSRELCTARRPKTNTPLQALATLNDPAFVEAAQALAMRMWTHSTGETARAEFGFELCLSRKPTGKELERIVKLYREELERYKSDPEAASKLASKTAGGNASAAELSAWTVVANVLLNLDETITKS